MAPLRVSPGLAAAVNRDFPAEGHKPAKGFRRFSTDMSLRLKLDWTKLALDLTRAGSIICRNVRCEAARQRGSNGGEPKP